MSEMWEPETVTSSGDYYIMQESTPEVDPARQSMLGYDAFPAPRDPGVPTPGVVPTPIMAPASTKVPAPSGAKAWRARLFGLLALLPILDVLLTVVAMMVVGLWSKKDLREPARTNCRLTASWGPVLLLVEVVLVVIQIAVFITTDDFYEPLPSIPWGTPTIMALVIVGAHMLTCIVQTIQAYRGKTLRFEGFPLFR